MSDNETGGNRLTPSSSGQGSDVAELRSDLGTTSIAENVVSKIAGIAAREVDGVHELGGALQGAIGSVVGRIRGTEHRTAGVGVEVGTKQAAVDLTLKALYPASIHEVADSVRQNVIDRIEGMTGLEVTEVNIAVIDLILPGEESEAQSEPSRVE